MKFKPGNILATPGALSLEIDLLPYLRRHLTGDWGDLDQEDIVENESSLVHGYRLMSSYHTPNGKLWIITEADRSATTFLLPSMPCILSIPAQLRKPPNLCGAPG